MGSTGEPDRKRRHFTSISPTAGAAAETRLLVPCSDDKNLMLLFFNIKTKNFFNNWKLRKWSTLFLRISTITSKEQQEIHGDIVEIVNRSWEQLVIDLELRSICTCESANAQRDLQGSYMLEDGASFHIQDDFLSRLFESGAAESCTRNKSVDQMEDGTLITSEITQTILQNIISSINWTLHVSEDVASALQATSLEDGMQLKRSVDNSRIELRNLIMAVNELYLEHRLLASNIRNHRDMDAKFRAEQKQLAGELASTMLELEESNSNCLLLRHKEAVQKLHQLFF